MSFDLIHPMPERASRLADAVTHALGDAGIEYDAKQRIDASRWRFTVDPADEPRALDIASDVIRREEFRDGGVEQLRGGRGAG